MNWFRGLIFAAICLVPIEAGAWWQSVAQQSASAGAPAGAPTVTPILGFGGGGATPSTTAPTFSGLISGNATNGPWNGISYRVRGFPMPIAGTFTNLNAVFVAHTTNTWSLALIQNSANATALQCAATGPTTTCTSSATVTVAAGDFVGLVMCPGTFSAGACAVGAAPTSLAKLAIAMQFTSTNNNETFLYSDSSGNVSTSAQMWGSFAGSALWSLTETLVSTVMPTAGVIDHLYAGPYASPVAGSWIMTVYKNGAPTAVTCNITTIANCSDLTNSVSVVAGDTISMSVQPGGPGTPTAAAVKGAVRFVPTVPGESVVMANIPTNTSATVAGYINASGVTSTSLTEVPMFNLAPPIAGGFTLKKLTHCISTDPGAGKSRGLSLRLNSTTPGGAPTATINSGDTISCNGTTSPGKIDNVNSLTGIAGSDNLTLLLTPTGTPAAYTNFKASMVMTVP